MNTEDDMVNKIIETDKAVITDAENFYKTMPVNGGYTFPIIFVVCMLLFGLLLSFILGLVFGQVSFEALSGVLFALILIPIFGVIGSFIGAFIMHLIWKALGSSAEYEASYRSVAFAYGIFPAIAILNIVPYVGTIIYTAWFFWLMLFASQSVHKIDYQKAFNTLAIIGVIVLLISLLMEYSGRQFQTYVDESMEQAKRYEEQLKDATPSEVLENMAEMMRELEENEAFKKMQEQSSGLENILDTITPLDLQGLTPTGSIDPSQAQKLIFDINESSIYAEIEGNAETFTNDKGVWNKFTMDDANYSNFKSITRNCAQVFSNQESAEVTAMRADSETIETTPLPEAECQQMAQLRNALIYAYDEGGNPNRGIECQASKLLFGDAIGQGDNVLWLFCPAATYSTIEQ